MPTLLQINSTSNWGSTGKIAEQIGALARKDGWDVYVAYGRYANTSELPNYRIGGEWDNRWHFLQSRYLDREGMASCRATKRLCKKIDELKPDIIHLHNIHGHYLNYKLLVQHINKRHIPVVWTLHDSWTMTGHCYLFGGTGCQKWKTECHNCPMKQTFCPDRSTQNYRRKKSVFTSMENVHLVAVSKWLENVVAQSYLKNYPHQTIYNGIDLKVFSPRKNDVKETLGLTGKHIILAVASAWSESKGLKDYYTLAEQLPQDCAIVLVGLTQEQKEKLPHNIMGIPLTKTQAELVELYTAADVVLSLSKGESFGLTPVEGMACGVPAVVYANGALPELVEDGTGVVVKEGDMTGLLNAISHFTNMNDEQRQNTKKACLERSARLFDKNYNFSEYILLYNRVLRENLTGGG